MGETQSSSSRIAEWDEMAASWDAMDAVRAYSRAAFRSLETSLQVRGRQLSGARVLDFGCGTGLLTELLAPVAGSVLALDASEKMVAVVTEKARESDWTSVTTHTGEVDEALLTARPELVGAFDLVVCSSVCAFVDDYPKTARLLGRCLKSGALFVQWDWELNPDDAEPYGLSRDQIRAALLDAGFEDVDVRVGFEEPFEDRIMRPLMGVGRKA